MYKQFRNIAGEVIQDYVCRIADNAFIPFDPANTDYAEYLRWLDAGNTPLPSESVADSATSDSVDESTTNQGV